MTNSQLHKIDNRMRPLIIEIMRRDGRDFGYCELGSHKIEGGRFDLHHTKYEGATYYDLLIACRRCNCKARGII